MKERHDGVVQFRQVNSWNEVERGRTPGDGGSLKVRVNRRSRRPVFLLFGWRHSKTTSSN